MFGLLNANFELQTDVKKMTRWDTAQHKPESVLLPVHLAPDDGEEGLGINEDPDTVLLNDLVELAGLVHVF
jgi:hypothetical protein